MILKMTFRIKIHAYLIKILKIIINLKNIINEVNINFSLILKTL